MFKNEYKVGISYGSRLLLCNALVCYNDYVFAIRRRKIDIVLYCIRRKGDVADSGSKDIDSKIRKAFDRFRRDADRKYHRVFASSLSPIISLVILNERATRAT